MDAAADFGYWARMRPLLATLRESRDIRSIGGAACALFLIAGLFAAFSSSAALAGVGGDQSAHCLEFEPDDDSDGDEALACCTLGCAMGTSISLTPAGSGELSAPPASTLERPIANVASSTSTRPPLRYAPRGPPNLV